MLTCLKIINIIFQNIYLFDSFDNVYLFGSVLNKCENPNDVDILLIYSEYSNKLISDLKLISGVLEEKVGLPIDLTVLSNKEEMDVKFLKRISSSYLKIK